MLFSYYRRPLFLILVVYCVLVFLFISPEKYDGPAVENGKTELCGRVNSYPEALFNGVKFEFEASYGGEKRGFAAYLKESGGLSYHDTACLRGTISRPYGGLPPGNLDWARFLARRGIYLEVRAERPYSIKKAGFPFSTAAAVRRRLLDIFEKKFSGDTAGLLSGVVLGDKKKISAPLKEAFQNSGAMHLLVASGSNVGFLMGLFSFIFWKLMKLGKTRSLLLSVFLTGIYVLCAGLAPPLTRAYLMTIFAMLALIFQRKTDLFQTLFVSGLAILLVSPRSLFDPGFQMSFAAVYGIVTGFACWGNVIRIKNRAFSWMARLFLITIFSQAALFPLLVVYFHKFSLISFLSNMLLVPLSGFLMYSGFTLFVLADAGFLSPFFIFVTKVAAAVFIKLVYFFGSFEYSAVYIPNFNSSGFIALSFLIFFLLHLPLFPYREKSFWFLPGAALFVLAASFFFPKKDFQLYFYEKGVGSGIFSVSNRLIAVNPVSDKLAKSALYYGYERLDAVLITSSETFRPEALAEITGIVPVSAVYAPFWVVSHSRQMTGSEIVRVWPGDICGKGFSIRPFWPTRRGGPGYSGLYRQAIGYLVDGKKIVRPSGRIE